MPSEEIARLFGVTADFMDTPRFNITPSQSAPVVVGSAQGPRLGPVRWGFHVGSFQKGRHHINARSETVHSKPAFRTAFTRRRCVVPASGFYEWKVEEKAKIPFWVFSRAEPSLRMAGVWGRDPEWDGAKEHRRGTAGFAILTQQASAQMTRIHNRMPVLLTQVQAELWLDPDASPKALRDLLADTDVHLTAHPVSTLVNRPANDSVECVKAAGLALF